jgi:rhamnose utilization protein RhaD (predicted bifunctional aldolase and dehydrogenase)/NAD(P)-dependent dehydrogenase (short-subunit alcohol dehydrogenase family)
MENRWSDTGATKFIEKYAKQWGEDLALGLYSASLIGSDSRLVLHGGGNSSVKATRTNILGQPLPAIFVKASGFDMAQMEPEGFTPLNLEYLRMLRVLPSLSDVDMVNEFRTHCLEAHASLPSIETLVHVFVPYKFVHHTHADAILALTNQSEGEKLVREALGDGIIVLPYITPGFKLAKALAEALEQNPSAGAAVFMHHGLVTWGNTARESYGKTIELTQKAEACIRKYAMKPVTPRQVTPLDAAQKRYADIAPMVRGLLATANSNPDRPWTRMILRPLINRDILDLMDSDRGHEIARTSPLTADHLIRTKPYYLWVDAPDFDNLEHLREQLSRTIQGYATEYNSYVKRNATAMPASVQRMDPMPRVILMPGLGGICAGTDAAAADIARDIAEHTLAVKSQIASMGTYRGMDEKALFDMEYRAMQQSKLQNGRTLPLARQVALITGAAGAIGSGIANELLEQGCHVAVSDLEGDALTTLTEELTGKFGRRVAGIALDVTNPKSVAEGFRAIARIWGGIDLVVLNAGVAHVAPISELSLESFQKLERINIEGTVLVLAEAARHFKLQRTGGDIILVSTKNVFAPGARFGAYSATKAAGHQLARIASQEFAELDVRVNMVAPDAVFSHGSRKSGLWTEIGPERMAARGLSPEGLEEYYRNRNLLKARVTARHVARAVLYFATRQTPTTGATIPVDGGLPDATPR